MQSGLHASRGRLRASQVWTETRIYRGAEEAHMKKWIALLVVALIALGTLAARGGTPVALDGVSSIVVEAGTIERTVKASGRVEALRTESVCALETGVLAELRAEDEPEVCAGDRLASLDGREIDAELAMKRIEWERVRGPVLSGLEADLSKARLTMATAERDQRAALQLAERAAISEFERAAKEDALQAARLAIESVEEDLLAARLDVEQIEAEVKRLEDRLARCESRVPFDGWVSRRSPIRVGSRVEAGDPLFEVSDLTSLRVRLKVPELDATQVEVGQRARVLFDSVPPIEEQGIVAWISPVALVETDQTSVEVLLQLDVPSTRLRPGNQVEVRLVVGRAEEVPLLPLSAVQTADGEDFVEVLTTEGSVRRSVTLGVRDLDRAEVRSGVEPGDRVRIATAPHRGGPHAP